MGDGLGPLAIGCVLCECEGGFERDPKLALRLMLRSFIIEGICGRTQCSVGAVGQGHFEAVNVGSRKFMFEFRGGFLIKVISQLSQGSVSAQGHAKTD